MKRENVRYLFALSFFNLPSIFLSKQNKLCEARERKREAEILRIFRRIITVCSLMLNENLENGLGIGVYIV